MPFLTIIATIFSVFGQIFQARAQSQAANYNAQVAVIQAKQAREKAALDESRQRKQARRLASTAQSRAGASGVTIQSFSPVFEESTREAELDALIIRHEGETARFGYLAEANLSRAEARNAKKAGIFNVGTTLLGGGQKLYEQTSKIASGIT